jgi:ribosomal peptide maturation radical SAM protein 1
VRIVLVNMPFAAWNRPSFALSQLATLTRREFPEHEVEVRYLNLDFARYLGAELYRSIAGGLDHLLTGLGEWFFRPVAFRDQPDNAAEYFARYYRGSALRAFRDQILERRAGLPEFCAAEIDRYGLDSADLVGFTSMFAQHLASIGMARLIKERNPAVVTVIGGANCEAPMGTVVAQQLRFIDAVFSGPALQTFPRYLRTFPDDEASERHRIPGVLTARNSNLQLGSSIGADRSIDDDIPPDYSAFMAAYEQHASALAAGGDEKPELMFETSRGCWWGERSHCTFCGLNGLGMGYRSMAPEIAVRQFERLLELAPWCESFACTDNIMPKSYPKEVFPHLRTPPGVTFFYEIKLPISNKDLESMAAAGVTALQPGIEAMATSTLKLMRKGTTAFLNIQFLKNCVRYGLNPSWNLLIGFPGEAEGVYEKYHADLPLLRHLPPPTGAHAVRFDRFSPYFDHPEEYGLALEPLAFYGLAYSFPASDIATMAYFFADTKLAEYTITAAKWNRPLNELIRSWRDAGWETTGAERPQLRVIEQDGGHAVLDTRFDTSHRHVLTPNLHALLRRLESPQRPDRLAAEAGLDQTALSRLIDWCDERDLLFREDDRIMSLVLCDETAGH